MAQSRRFPAWLQAAPLGAVGERAAAPWLPFMCGLRTMAVGQGAWMAKQQRSAID